jgi:hypothetical protein
MRIRAGWIFRKGQGASRLGTQRKTASRGGLSEIGSGVLIKGLREQIPFASCASHADPTRPNPMTLGNMRANGVRSLVSLFGWSA